MNKKSVHNVLSNYIPNNWIKIDDKDSPLRLTDSIKPKIKLRNMNKITFELSENIAQKKMSATYN